MIFGHFGNFHLQLPVSQGVVRDAAGLGREVLLQSFDYALEKAEEGKVQQTRQGQYVLGRYIT